MPGNSPIRVAQVVRPAEGGVRRHVSLLIGALNSSLFSSELFAPESFVLEEFGKQTPTHSVDIAPTTSIVRDIRAASSLTSMLDGRFDLVHNHGLRAALIGVIAASRCKLPSIFTAHNLPPSLSALQRFGLMRISNGADAIIAVSEAVSEGLQAYGVKKKQIHVIPNGIKLDEHIDAPPLSRAEVGLTSEGSVVAFVGRLAMEKGLDTLLDAFETVVARHPETHLLVVGAGPDDARLRSRAYSVNGIHFLGARSDVPSLLAAADIVVVPSYSEGQGIVAIEAMASSRPVVASNVGGLPETVLDGETAILTPSRDSRALAAAIIALIDDPLRASTMGAAGKQRAFAQYSVERMVGSVQQLYDNVLRSHGK